MNRNIAPVHLNANATKRTFIYQHVISFEETNVVGNVYFTRHIAWQGRCRELFLKQNAPTILDELRRDLRLVTLRVSCEYFDELKALEEIEVQMMLAHLVQHKIGLEFNIVRPQYSGSLCVARGFQEIGCMRATDKGLVSICPPTVLIDALKPYA